MGAAISSQTEFESVIGLEVHCQLSTNTKIFCGCRAKPGEGSVGEAGANIYTCPVCTGQPGALPVLNAKVVEYAVRTGLALGCEIRLKNVFSRKNYFYPDLPKGYQISQYDLPICENGKLEIMTSNGSKTIRVQRIHMEEDAGKSVHEQGYSLVNLNRGGVPLIEIVSHPDLRTADEAGAYLRALHAVVTYLGVCDGNMQEGNFRCDANVSIMPKGSKELGTRTEIKNVNSFRFVEKAIEYEIRRQIEVVNSGGRIIQETRLYDSDKNQTFSMRSKEEAHDYRYFPDPDLIPLQLTEEYVKQIRASLPELPEQMRGRYVAELGLSPYDAGVITGSKNLARFFDETLEELLKGCAIARTISAKPVANLLTGEVARRLNDEGIEITASRLKPIHLADVIRLTSENALSSTGAKQVLASAMKTGDSVSVIVEREGLRQVLDLSIFEPAIDQIIVASPGQVAEFKAGKDKLIGFFVGQAMKATGGKANPAMLQELIRRKLNSYTP